MSNRGIQKETYEYTSSAQLERNRLTTLTKSTGVVAYASCGSVPSGVTTTRSAHSDIDDCYRNDIWPISSKNRTIFVTLAGTVSRGDLLFPTTSGCAVKSSYTAATRGIAAEPTPSADAIYLLPATVTGTNWSTHGNAVGVYTYATTTWSFVDVSSTTNVGLTVYVSDEKNYYTWSGTAWVVARGVLTADDSGVAGQDIPALAVEEASVDALPSNLNYGIVLMSQYSGNPGGTSVTILDSRVVAGDKVICQFQGGTTAAYVVSAVATTGTITLTLSANSGASSLITYIVVRQL